MLLVSHNRALVSILIEYRGLWAETMARLPSLAESLGGGFQTRTEASAFEALHGDLIKLDVIVAALEVQAADAGALAHGVAKNLGPVLRAYLKSPILHLTPKEQ